MRQTLALQGLRRRHNFTFWGNALYEIKTRTREVKQYYLHVEGPIREKVLGIMILALSLARVLFCGGHMQTCARRIDKTSSTGSG